MIRIGIIGTGNMAHHHVKRYKEIEDVSLTACCDVSKDAVKAFAEKWQINGALGTIHSTRWARGFKNREFICVHGDQGSVEVDFERGLDKYRVRYESLPEWREVTCAPTLTNEGRFVQAIRSGENDSSDFENGLKIQAYLHYSVISDQEKRAIKIEL